MITAILSCATDISKSDQTVAMGRISPFDFGSSWPIPASVGLASADSILLGLQRKNAPITVLAQKQLPEANGLCLLRCHVASLMQSSLILRTLFGVRVLFRSCSISVLTSIRASVPLHLAEQRTNFGSMGAFCPNHRAPRADYE